jgi:hypothetical protein
MPFGPFDSLDPPLDPGDPRTWWQNLSPNSQPYSPSALSGSRTGSSRLDGYPDDWIVPGNARTDPHPDYPDDWITLPPSIAPGTVQPAPSPQPSAPNPTISNRPAARPDPLAAFWARIPASYLTQFAWHPPIFPDSLGRYPLAPPPPRDLPPFPRVGLLADLADPPARADAPSFPTGGLLGGLAQLQPAPVDMSRLGLLGAFASSFNNQTPSFPASSANLPWSPPPSASGIGDYPGLGREPAGSNALTGASYPPSLPSYFQPSSIAYQDGSSRYAYLGNDPLYSADPTGLAPDQPLTDQTPHAGVADESPNVILVGDKEEEEESPEGLHGKIDPGVFSGITDRALGASPKQLPTLPLLLPFFPRPPVPPPSAAQPRPLPGASLPPPPLQAPPLPAAPTTPQSPPTSSQGSAPPGRQSSPSALPPGQNPVGEAPARLDGGAGGNSPAPSSGAELRTRPTPSWRQFEQKHGSVQTTQRTTFQGKDITVRLDFPPEEKTISDLKEYNWWKPAYLRPFIQRRVIEDFQTQIQKYQSLRPNVRYEFSAQPPPWVVQAIERVGGTYLVKPDP